MDIPTAYSDHEATSCGFNHHPTLYCPPPSFVLRKPGTRPHTDARVEPPSEPSLVLIWHRVTFTAIISLKEPSVGCVLYFRIATHSSAWMLARSSARVLVPSPPADATDSSFSPFSRHVRPTDISVRLTATTRRSSCSRCESRGQIQDSRIRLQAGGLHEAHPFRSAPSGHVDGE
jgi:hypothetical protein